MKPKHKEYLASLGPTRTVSGSRYRGWTIDWEYGWYVATGPNYDASYGGPEDGWVSNGHRVQARTPESLLVEIDDFIAENPDA